MNTINPKTSDAGPKWATKKKLAKHYGVCPRTIGNWLQLDLLVFFKIGRVLRFDIAACDASLKQYGLI